jgi:hypothetical protein
MSPEQRGRLIDQYATGPERLECALAAVPAAALQWRPGPGRWSVHEIIVHCADSETNAHMRLRYLVAERDPLILGYDQDRWATELDYHAHSLPLALATIRAVRANTVPLLQRLTESQWQRVGRHTEHPTFGVEPWLEAYGVHLDVHVRQIARNMEAWKKR